VVNPPPAPQTPFVYEQQLRGGRAPLVTLDQANTIIEKFRAAYPKMDKPRMVLFVNRELVDEQSGIRVVGRTVRTENGTNGGTRVTGENRYENTSRKTLSVEDRQTVRDVERLFGRPLRMAGVALADQRLATQLMPGRLPQGLSADSDQARKDREALSKIADVALEILTTSKNVTVTELSGDNTYVVPEIQVTAIGLKDARVLGQASSYDVTSRQGPAMARFFSFQEVAEATALALMEDMTTGIDVPQTAEANK
jgi:hypothetical protein